MEPNLSGTGTPAQEPGASLTRPMLIGGAILAVLVLGAIYFWQNPGAMGNRAADVNSETWMPASSGSDKAAAIQAELEATNMSEFESTMNADAEAAASGL